MKNSNQRMRELYQEAIDGHKHERKTHGNGNGVGWYPHHNSDDFYSGTQYRIKKDKIEAAADEYLIETIKRIPILAERREIHVAFKAGWEACLKDRDNNND